MAAKKARAASPKAAPRKANKPTPPAMADDARAEVSADELQHLISEAAYYRAKSRGFEPGHELDDWFQAEAEVKKRIGA
jgi:hypothetical protein